MLAKNSNPSVLFLISSANFFDFGSTDTELIITQLSPLASGLTDDIDKINPSFVL